MKLLHEAPVSRRETTAYRRPTNTVDRALKALRKDMAAVHREDVEALKREAVYAGDHGMVRTCNLALDFSNQSKAAEEAWQECCRIIREARAPRQPANAPAWVGRLERQHAKL